MTSSLAPHPTTAQPLTGPALEQLLDRLEADLEEGESSQAIDLPARLRARVLQADSIEAIERLCNLWAHADDGPAALAVTQADGGALLAAAAPTQREELQMRLALCRLRIHAWKQDAQGTKDDLAAIRALAAQATHLDASQYLRLRTLDRLEENSPLDVVLEAIEVRHALEQAVPDRAAYRAFDLGNYHRRRARAFWHAQQRDEARGAALQAIAALRDAQAGQDVDEDDWLGWGNSLIEIVPDQLAAFEQPLQALTAGWTLPRRREMEVKRARLAARALHAQGNLQGALDACATAHGDLESSCTGSDDFIDHELPWLIEAGRFDEAGQRAFMHIYRNEDDLWPGAVRIVHEQLARAPESSIWWPLCALRACNTASTLRTFMAHADTQGRPLQEMSPTHAQLFAQAVQGGEALENEDEEDEQQEGKEGNALTESVFSAARAMVQARAPQHPWLRRLAAMHDHEQGRIDATAAAAQMNAAALETAMQDGRTQNTLFRLRAKALGMDAALALPPPTLDSGRDAYECSGWIDHWMDEHLPDAGPLRTRATEIRRLIYEQGIAHCERYHATGQGHPRDACAHLYSMMCNNLAIIYRWDGQRYEDAIDLHQRGIEASPFAEHYNGILSARIRMKDHAETVNAAERLWHYAAEYGYSRHDPNDYADDVAWALYKLDRDSEILIWLERLTQWQRQDGGGDSELSDYNLNARLRIADYLGFTRPDEAGALWDSIASQVGASKDYSVWENAGHALASIKRKPQAIAHFRKALELNPRKTEYERSRDQVMHDAIARLEAPPAKPAPSRSWWQFWK